MGGRTPYVLHCTETGGLVYCGDHAANVHQATGTGTPLPRRVRAMSAAFRPQKQRASRPPRATFSHHPLMLHREQALCQPSTLFHHYPLFGRTHDERSDCWCQPEEDVVATNLLIHHSEQ